MSGNWYIFSAILTASAVTWALRALPFAMLAPLRSSALVAYLGMRMPVGIMVILAVYTLRHVQPLVAGSVLPAVVALAVIIGLHLWRANMTLSLFAGTGVYVALATLAAG